MIKSKKIEERLGLQVSSSKSKFFNFIIEKEDKVFLLKVVPFNSSNELIVTSKYYFCIANESFSRNTKPNTIKRMKEFMDLSYETDKKVIKVLVLNPSALRIIKYINECDAVKVMPTDDIYGVRIVSLTNLEKSIL